MSLGLWEFGFFAVGAWTGYAVCWLLSISKRYTLIIERDQAIRDFKAERRARKKFEAKATDGGEYRWQ